MREIILCTAAAAIITAIFRMLIPDEKYGKQLSFAISCFFVLVIAGVIGNSNLDMSKLGSSFSSVAAYADYSDAQRDDIKKETALLIEERIAQILSEKGIEPEEISSVVDISDNNSISIKQIRLVFQGGFTALSQAEETVRGVVGNETEVICEITER